MGKLKQLNRNPVVNSLNRQQEPIVACEICGKEIRIGESYSFVIPIIFATVGPFPKQSAFQCPNEQHFGCSIEHAREAAIACIDEHLIPFHKQLTGG